MLSMLWRLNFLVLLLVLMMDNTYILYYICPLHTFYFFVTYVVMRLGRGYNLSKWEIRAKLMVTGIVIFLVWDVDKFFDFAFFFLPTTPGVQGAKNGVRYEWQFRTGLDHFATVFGMVRSVALLLVSLSPSPPLSPSLPSLLPRHSVQISHLSRSLPVRSLHSTSRTTRSGCESPKRNSLDAGRVGP